MDVKQRIRQYIKDNGMTLTFVAGRAGMDVKKLSRLLNTNQKMSTDEYEKICMEGLKVDPAFFYKEKFLESKNLSTA